MTGWRIVGWERYEVNYHGRPWSPGEIKRLGPLAYIRWQVNASNPRNDGWDRLLAVATSRRVIIAYGVFGKCLEMVAELPWYARDGAIRVKCPTPTGIVWRAALLEDIGCVTGASLRHVGIALPILSDPAVCWLAEDEIEAIPERSATPRNGPEPSGTPSEVQGEGEVQVQGEGQEKKRSPARDKTTTAQQRHEALRLKFAERVCKWIRLDRPATDLLCKTLDSMDLGTSAEERIGRFIADAGTKKNPSSYAMKVLPEIAEEHPREKGVM